MPEITLEEAKAHLNLDHSEDDVILNIIILATEEAAENYINQKLSVIKEANENTFPNAIKYAMLLLIGTYYNHRESIQDSKLVVMPHGVEWLLDPYRIYPIA